MLWNTGLLRTFQEASDILHLHEWDFGDLIFTVSGLQLADQSKDNGFVGDMTSQSTKVVYDLLAQNNAIFETLLKVLVRKRFVNGCFDPFSGLLLPFYRILA